MGNMGTTIQEKYAYDKGWEMSRRNVTCSIAASWEVFIGDMQEAPLLHLGRCLFIGDVQEALGLFKRIGLMCC